MQYNLKHFDENGNVTPQWQFYHSRAPIQFFGGGFGNGKTTALIIKALNVIQNYPGANLLLARATYPQLNDSLRKFFMEWIPPEWVRKRPSQDDNTCYTTNGCTVNFRYVAQRGKQQSDGTTTSNLLSAVYDFIGVDQIEDPQIVHKDFLDLVGRLRGTTVYRPADGIDDPTLPPNGPRWLALTANPTGNWVYRELVSPVIIWRDRGVKTSKLMVDKSNGVPIIELFEGSTYTNKDNLPADYLRNMESTYVGQQHARYLMGEWAAFEGLVYGQYDRKVHSISREQAMLHMAEQRKGFVQLKALEGYDFGITSPSCYGLGFVDDHGRVIIVDGFYRPNFDYTEHAKTIKEIRSRYSNWLTFDDAINADPSIFKSRITGTKGRSDTIGKYLRDEGNLRIIPASNDIVSGIAKVGAYLNGRPDIPNPFTGKDFGPLLYVVDDLQWWHDEVVSYYWKRSPQGLHYDEPQDSNDHSMDVTKYMMNKLPAPSEIVIPADAVAPPWMSWHEQPDQDKYGNFTE